MYCKYTGLTKYANVSAYTPIPSYTDLVSSGAYADLVNPLSFFDIRGFTNDQYSHLFVKKKKKKYNLNCPDNFIYKK